MLFLLKRRWQSALAALAVLTAAGAGLRHLVAGPPPLDFSPHTVGLGVAVFAAVLVSDAVVHGLLCVLFGEGYLCRWRELAAVFRGQGLAAIFAGALMAGVGEELLFRGLSAEPAYLAGAAVAFGLLHHLPGRLAGFTPWAVYEGLLFAAAMYATGELAVTMTAHFLHDLTGFLLFRFLTRPAR